MQTNTNEMKQKVNVYNIIMKVIMYVGFYGLAILSSQSLFNLMPFTSQLSTIMQLGAGKAMIVVKYVVPLFVALLYYVIYSFFARMAVTSTYRSLFVLGQIADTNHIRMYLDGAMLMMVILKILCGILYLFFPYITVIAKPLFGIVISISAIAFAILGIASKYEKKYLPIIFNSMIAPMILLCIFA